MSRAAPVALVCLALAAAPAWGSPRQQAIFQDDHALLDAPPSQVARTLAEIRSLGADRVRMSVLWQRLAAPSAPRGDPTNPSAYPEGGWRSYDTAVRLAARRGLGVLLTVTGPPPRWALRPSDGAPDPSAYRAFVSAVGRRYGGTFVPAAGGFPLPRVAWWSVWNEPNQALWLLPQWRLSNGRMVEWSPRVYRELIDAAFAGLRRSGHGRDTILIGELAPAARSRPAPTSHMAPLRFLRALYCIGGGGGRLTGAAAEALGCPGQGGELRRRHAGLFRATGLAHHPWSPLRPPEARAPRRGWVHAADLPALARLTDRAFAAYGVRRRLPLYVTEFGYQTEPDPYAGISPARQASWLNRAELLAWRNPRVLSWAQFLLRDDPPSRRFPARSPLRWGGFQSGLRTATGRRKPAYAAYRLPFQAERREARWLRIWGQVRPAANGTDQTAQIEFRPARRARFRRLLVLRTRQARGFLTTRVRAPGAGSLRMTWRDRSTGVRRASRIVSIGGLRAAAAR